MRHWADRDRARLRWTRRLAVLALTQAVLIAQLVGFAHEVSAHHVVCAEHGEQVDEVTTKRPAATATADSRATSGTDPVAEHGHEHCAFSLFAHGRTTVSSPPTVVVAAPPIARIVARPPPVVAVDTDALLHYAPKTSPPLV